MKKKVWRTQDGDPLTFEDIDDLYLVNIGKHIVRRIETDLDLIDYYNSPYAPIGKQAEDDKELELAYANLELVSLKHALKEFDEEAKRRGLNIPTKEHINKWLE